MREIVLDTETTGLEPATGDRIVEIGAVELLNHMPTGKTFHHYINPDRPMPKEAFDIHGISDDFLSDKLTQLLGREPRQGWVRCLHSHIHKLFPGYRVGH